MNDIVNNEALYKSFFVKYFEFMKEFDLKFNAELYGINESNYWDIVLAPGSLELDTFEFIESRLKLNIPLAFKQFYVRHNSFENQFDLGGIQIAGNPRGKELNALSDYLFDCGFSEEINQLRLIPFGTYQDEWIICFDTVQNKENPPIVLYEMSLIGSGSQAVSQLNWFSDFSNFIACMIDYIGLDGSDENFDKIDPGNHFTSAYYYWNNQ